MLFMCYLVIAGYQWQKGIFAEGEYDQKVEAIWDRDYEELVLNFHQDRKSTRLNSSH